MKYDNEKYVNIKTVCEYLESSFSDNLLKFHSLTGYYSTSYFYRVGKIKVWKNLVKKTENKLILIRRTKGSVSKWFWKLSEVRENRYL